MVKLSNKLFGKTRFQEEAKESEIDLAETKFKIKYKSQKYFFAQ